MNITTFDDLLSAARAPTSEDAEQPLQDRVQAIRMGQLQAFIPFNPQGEAVQLG